MFTGLIADKARVVSISRGADSAVIEIESVLIPEIKTGDSVSINGSIINEQTNEQEFVITGSVTYDYFSASRFSG